MNPRFIGKIASSTVASIVIGFGVSMAVSTVLPSVALVCGLSTAAVLTAGSVGIIAYNEDRVSAPEAPEETTQMREDEKRKEQVEANGLATKERLEQFSRMGIVEELIHDRGRIDAKITENHVEVLDKFKKIESRLQGIEQVQKTESKQEHTELAVPPVAPAAPPATDIGAAEVKRNSRQRIVRKPAAQ